MKLGLQHVESSSSSERQSSWVKKQIHIYSLSISKFIINKYLLLYLLIYHVYYVRLSCWGVGLFIITLFCRRQCSSLFSAGFATTTHDWRLTAVSISCHCLLALHSVSLSKAEDVQEPTVLSETANAFIHDCQSASGDGVSLRTTRLVCQEFEKFHRRLFVHVLSCFRLRVLLARRSAARKSSNLVSRYGAHMICVHYPLLYSIGCYSYVNRM